jgi:hypothetical protein
MNIYPTMNFQDDFGNIIELAGEMIQACSDFIASAIYENA